MITFINKRASLFILSGALCMVLGCLLVKFRPQKILINYIFSFHDGGQVYNWWRNSSQAGIYLKAYAFNITNPTEFMAGQEKLKLQEVGPFVYREMVMQEEAVLNDNGTVTSKPKYEAIWVPELNKLDENITLWLPNVPMLSWANEVATELPFLRIPTNALLFGPLDSQPIQQMTWRAFGFGQENPLVTLGHTLFPNRLPVKEIGLLNLLNDMSGIVVTSYTGANDVRLSGLVDRLNGLEYLRQWSYPCNSVRNSTMGFKIKTNIGDEEEFLFYYRLICRTLPFVPASPKENRHGIPTRLYKIREDALDNGARNPDHLCYCKKGECLPDGLSDISDCIYGYSGVISYPHFYNANSSLLEAVEGLNPKRELHETSMRANQDTGIITEFSYKVQFNLRLGDIRGLSRCEQFANMVVPVIWFEIYMPSIPFIDKVRLFLLLRVQPITDVLCAYGLIIFGICLFFYARRALLFRSKLFLRLRLMSQDLSNAIETGQPSKEGKEREGLELEIHSKLMPRQE